jgi:hypothetical protein
MSDKLCPNFVRTLSDKLQFVDQTRSDDKLKFVGHKLKFVGQAN